jgi:hypothetical protein
VGERLAHAVPAMAMPETGRLLTDDVEPRRIDTRAFGRAAPRLEARIVGDDDRELPPGQPLEKKPKVGVSRGPQHG